MDDQKAREIARRIIAGWIKDTLSAVTIDEQVVTFFDNEADQENIDRMTSRVIDLIRDETFTVIWPEEPTNPTWVASYPFPR